MKMNWNNLFNQDAIDGEGWSFTVTAGDPLDFHYTPTASDYSFALATTSSSKMVKPRADAMRPTRCVLNPPATILFWPDGDKTIVKCQDGDPWDSEKGIACAMLKKYFGGDGKYNDIINNLLKGHEVTVNNMYGYTGKEFIPCDGNVT